MRQHANSDTFNWMSLQSHWKPDKTLYTVVLLGDDGEPDGAKERDDGR